MKNWKKWLSLTLVLALLLSVAQFPTHAEGAVALADPGFEGDLWNDGVWSYWIPDDGSWSDHAAQNFLYSSDEWMTPASDGGDQCLKFDIKADGGAFYFTQVLTDVPAGTYTLAAQAMGAGGESVYVRFGDELGTTVQTDSGYNNWTEVSGTFTLNADCAELIVGLYITGSAGSWGYVDSMTLTAQSQGGGQPETPDTPADFEQLPLENGDFELGNANNWILSGYSEVSTDEWASNNASYALNLWLSDDAEAAGSAAYSVLLTAGTYYFTFDLAGGAQDSGLNYAVTAGETELTKGESTVTTGGWDVWQTVTTAEFTLDAETLVTFTLSGTQPAAYFGDLDNLKLFGTGALAVKIPDPVEAEIYVPRINGTAGDDFMRGMDISSLLSVLNSGVSFKDFDGNELDGQGFMDLLAESGTNWVRIRVWNDPFDANGDGYGGGNCDIEAAKVMGQWATNAGMRVLIDFHFSDFWADPGKQQAPKAWAGYDLTQKTEAVYNYTLASLEYLTANGVDVGMVQIGNETTSKFCGESTWANICTLFNAGARAVRAVSGDILVAIHFTNPERATYASYYAKTLADNNVDYDVFASSYYPYWHGTLENLTQQLKAVADTYDKQVIVAETSWAYTLEDGDGHDNTVRQNNNDSETYPFTVQGQATEVASVTQAVRNVGQKGVGIFYWEPAWIPVGTPEELEQNKLLWEAYGSGWASSYAVEYDPNDAGVWYGGSSWDNQAMFDFQGNPLASLKTYLYMQTGTTGFDIVITAVEEPVLNYTVGDTLVLPETLAVSFNVGADETRAVTWNEADAAAVDMNVPGTYVVNGTVEGGVAAVCTVIVKAENLLRNPGMEQSDMSMYTISQSYARRKTDDPHSGSYSMHFYNSGVVSFTAEQTVTLQPGHYEFSLYGQGGDLGEDAVTYAYVKIGEQLLTADFALTGWAIWANPTVAFAVSEETDVVVGISITASQSGAWGTFDDWYLCVDASAAHSYTAEVTEPTCTEDGYTTYTCACGDSYVTDEIPSTGHTPGDPATWTEAQTCTACGETLAPALKDAVAEVVAELEEAIAALEQEMLMGDQTNADELKQAIAELEAKVAAAEAAAKQYAEEQDDVLKADLEQAIRDARDLLQTAIDELELRVAANEAHIAQLQADLAQAIADLNRAIANGDQANAEALTAAIAKLEKALADAVAALERADSDNKSALEALIAEAKTALEAAIAQLRADLEDAIKDLENADKENAEALAQAIKDLTAAIEAAEAAASAGDTAIRAELAEARAALNTTITRLRNELYVVRGELLTIMNEKDAALDGKIAQLAAALEAAAAASQAADDAQKAELTAAIEAAEAALTAAIEQVSADLSKAEAQLIEAIASGDKTLDDKISGLNEVLTVAIAAADAANETLRAELTARIDEAVSALNAAISAVQKELTDSKAEQKAKDEQQDTQMERMNTFLIVVCVIAGVGLAGCAALLIYIVMDKRRKV